MTAASRSSHLCCQFLILEYYDGCYGKPLDGQVFELNPGLLHKEPATALTGLGRIITDRFPFLRWIERIIVDRPPTVPWPTLGYLLLSCASPCSCPRLCKLDFEIIRSGLALAGRCPHERLVHVRL